MTEGLFHELWLGFVVRGVTNCPKPYLIPLLSDKNHII